VLSIAKKNRAIFGGRDNLLSRCNFLFLLPSIWAALVKSMIGAKSPFHSSTFDCPSLLTTCLTIPVTIALEQAGGAFRQAKSPEYDAESYTQPRI
jgi:hypothetical protein